MIRLYSITQLAKSEQHLTNWRYFLEETLVAAIALTAIPAVLAAVGYGDLMLQLRSGFTTVLTGEQALPGLCIGVLYACLYFFGSHIYLHPRENTFSIPLNRCASLMSGVVASYGLTYLLGLAPPPAPNSCWLLPLFSQPYAVWDYPIYSQSCRHNCTIPCVSPSSSSTCLFAKVTRCYLQWLRHFASMR